MDFSRSLRLRSDAAARVRINASLRRDLANSHRIFHWKLFAELAEVMVHVEVTPAQPVAIAHGAEKRMLRDDRARVGEKTLEQGSQFGDVCDEFRGARASDELVDVGACFG